MQSWETKFLQSKRKWAKWTMANSLHYKQLETTTGIFICFKQLGRTHSPTAHRASLPCPSFSFSPTISIFCQSGVKWPIKIYDNQEHAKWNCFISAYLTTANMHTSNKIMMCLFWRFKKPYTDIFFKIKMEVKYIQSPQRWLQNEVKLEKNTREKQHHGNLKHFPNLSAN